MLYTVGQSYTILSEVLIESENQQFNFINIDGGQITLSLTELLGILGIPIAIGTTEIQVSGYDPFYVPLQTMSNAPIPNLSYYVHDHLGNTRVVYKTSVTCSGNVTYALDAVMDYYPYAKILREFIHTPEKYVSTHHERDKETGLDYRGARFYDSDVARFLSLDPHAIRYPNSSDYMYVLGNPIILIDPNGKDSYYVLNGDKLSYV